MGQNQREKFRVSIKDCNNISSADFDLYKKELNLRYALNGTGKSTLSKSIHSFSNGLDLGFLKPFGSESTPAVDISEELGEVLIFNEEFVNNTVFNESEVIENGFEVFLKSEDYDRKVESLNEKIKSLKIGIQENEHYKVLQQRLITISQKLKLNSDGLTIKNDSVMKSITSKENSFKIPIELEGFRPFLEHTDLHIHWIDWKNTGEKYDEISGCPFCTKELEENYPKQKEVFKKSYKKAMVKNLKDILDLFESLEDFLDKTKYNLIIDCIKTESDPMTITQEVTKLRIEIQGITDKIENITRFNQLEIKRDEISKIGEYLENSKIVIEGIDYFKSDQSLNLFKEINSKIDDLLKIVDELKQEIGSFYGFVNGKISEVKKEINDFLRTAGINYELEIVQEGSDKFKTILKYVNGKDKKIEVDRIIEHLSWGEKNAFSLVLFMYYAMSRNPDLIILDDPVSSFDDIKKYAIINHLFKSKGNSLSKKTVLLLTHDFEPIIDFIVVNKPTGAYVNAEYLRNNKNGEIESHPIKKENVTSWITLLHRYSIDSNLCIINRIAFLRKYIELHNTTEEQKNGYEIISSLQHGHSAPKVKIDDSLINMKDDKIQDGIKYIRAYILDFDYQRILSELQSEEKIRDYYKNQEKNYLKLQIFRTYLEVSRKKDQVKDSPLIKFIDETYHVENDYIYFLDLMKYEIVPDHIIESCDRFILN